MTVPSLTLAALREQHAPALFELTRTNHLHLRRWLPWVDHVLKPEDTQTFVQTCLAKVDAGEEKHYLLMADGVPTGIISVIDIDTAQGVGTVGYWIAEAQQGSGLMTAALGQVQQWALADWGLSRLRLEYLVGNDRSRRLALRCGFQQTDVIADGAVLYGVPLDRVVCAWPAQD